MPLPEPYRWIAPYYDLLFQASRAPAERARGKILEPLLEKVETACDLACGTGTTALELARRGIRMTGVDLSPAMCRLAREKARSAGLPLDVLRADMRDFRLQQPVDLITCEFDALNHVPHKRNLSAVARAVARALRPGGHFYFDVNNSAGFKSYWTGTMWVERRGVVLAMRNGNDWRRDRAWCDLEWFIREGRCWRRHRERVEEVCWSGREIRSALREAGFTAVRAWDAAPFFTRNAAVAPGCRSVYLARRAGPAPAGHRA